MLEFAKIYCNVVEIIVAVVATGVLGLCSIFGYMILTGKMDEEGDQ